MRPDQPDHMHSNAGEKGRTRGNSRYVSNDCGGIALVIPGHEQRNKYCFRHKYNNRERAHFFSLPWRQCRTLAIIIPSAALGVPRCAEEVFDETLSCARSNCLCFPYWRYLLRRSSPQGCEALCR